MEPNTFHISESIAKNLTYLSRFYMLTYLHWCIF